MSPKTGDGAARRARRRDCGRLIAALFATGALPSGAGAIVGGTEGPNALARSAIMVLNSRGGVCSGVVLAPDVVLTAAHCVAGKAEIRVHYRGEDGKPVLIAPAARALHPGYDAGAVAGRRRSVDLALLRVSDPPLPSRFGAASLSGAAPAKGVAVAVGGYGLAREGDPRSSGTFRTAELAVVEPYGRSSILLWASGRNGAGACEGDSGGPMADPAGLVVAITSWASGDAKRSCGAMSQGILLGPQRSWIDRTLAAWGRTASWR